MRISDWSSDVCSSDLPRACPVALAAHPASGERRARFCERRCAMPERKRETIYQEVTDRIIAELEAGRVPWAQPWGAAKAALGLPKNAATGRDRKSVV